MKLFKNSRKNALIYFIVVILVLISFFPAIWMLSTAFKTPEDVFTIPPQLVPDQFTLLNFKQIFSNNIFLTYYRNSLIVSTSTVVLCLVVAIFAGYSFSRFQYKGSSFMQFFILISQMFPLVLLLISIYVIFLKIGLTDSLYGLILADCTFAIPFSVWMLKGFFDTIPKDIEEAAKLDGCSRMGILSKVVIPLLKPGIIATAIYIFLLSWDDYIFALTLTSSTSMRTLPVGISLTYLGEFQYRWGELMAASCSAALPITIIFIFLQKFLVKGLTGGAVKG